MMLLQELHDKLKKENYCRIQGQFKLTKTQESFTDALVYRDRDLEQLVYNWIESRSTFQTLLEKYRKYDPDLKDTDRPHHYAGRFICGSGSICSGKNIFMLFPLSMGLPHTPENDKNAFGIEFIDVWSNIFRSTIFPIVEQKFNISTTSKLLSLQNNLDKTIFLAAIFHEFGHRSGPYKLTDLYNLSPEVVDVMGELATDSLLVTKLAEFPEIASFVVLQRLFWFGRQGYSENPISGRVNQDNDVWIGSFLWSRLRDRGALILNNGLYELRIDQLPWIFLEITTEIDALIDHSLPKEAQNQMILQWMRRSVPYENGKFCFPEDFKLLLSQLNKIPEIPPFQMPYSYHQMESLLEAIG
jgi:hypothetical protein